MSAFTRVFDALWPGCLRVEETGVLRSGMKNAASRPGHNLVIAGLEGGKLEFVMRGLDPRIHLLRKESCKKEGSPGQAGGWRFPWGAVRRSIWPCRKSSPTLWQSGKTTARYQGGRPMTVTRRGVFAAAGAAAT